MRALVSIDTCERRRTDDELSSGEHSTAAFTAATEAGSRSPTRANTLLQEQAQHAFVTNTQPEAQARDEPTLRHEHEVETLSSDEEGGTWGANELLQQAHDMLSSITAMAPLQLETAKTNFSPLLNPQSSTPILDYIQARVGPGAGTSLRKVKTIVGFIYGGSRYNSLGPQGQDEHEGKIDWSIRGVVNTMTRAMSQLSSARLPLMSTSGASSTSWFSKLANFGTSKGQMDEWELENALFDVLQIAEDAGRAGSAEGWQLKGDLHLTGHLTLPENTTAAAEAYTRASQDYGLPEAQYKLGFLYSSNFGGAFGGVEGSGSQGSALVHYTFAALSGHVSASMTVGYRHWMGIGTKKSCKDALSWYKAAADAAMRSFNAGPPGGRHLPPPKLRLSDLNGGAYGPGASASQRVAVTGGSTSQSQQEWDDLLEFHHFHASRGRGEPMYMFRLARLYYQGFGGTGLGGVRGGKNRLKVGMPSLQDKLGDGGRDFAKASRWFLALTAKVWRKDPPKEAYVDLKASASGTAAAPKVFKLAYDDSKDQKITTDEQTIMYASLAAGYLGRMYLRGEGTSPNYQKAYLWFARGASQGDRESNNGLGILYRDGLGVDRDLKKANMFFHAAAQHDLAEAQVNLGKYHFGIGEYALATTYFEHAIRTDGTRAPDTFQSFYYLAELNARALNRDEQCPVAVSFYKIVAERGDWDHEVWWEAERALLKGDERTALLGYWIMAERGYESAQNNVAWIMDRSKQRLQFPPHLALHQNESDRLALAYWTRSAAQDNVDALVKTGDYYFSGYGTPEPQQAKAAACYQSASSTLVSAMAMWNLGWMHETGQGVAQDFHLAKRYYDQALETSADAYFPASLSLVSLYIRALYHAVTASPGDDVKAVSLLSDLVAPRTAEENVAGWGFARMWRDIQRRWGVELPPETQFEQQQLEQHYKAKTQAHQRQQRKQEARAEADTRRHEEHQALDAVNDDGWRAARRANGLDDEEEEDFYFGDGDGDFGGTVAIVGLCCLLGWLLYFRQGRVGAAAGAAARAGAHPAGVGPAAAAHQAPPADRRVNGAGVERVHADGEDRNEQHEQA
ncbi:ERAD-associated protein [Microbotryomycetes sp. JL221]|nr:ERAD-associated protein [Microbotryomycetes sp. JL221]